MLFDSSVLFKAHNVPMIEAGFNEELRYSSSHTLSLISLSDDGNGIVFVGSYSKVLYPGLGVGWILGDKQLISYLTRIKGFRDNRASNLNQAILYQYLKDGNLERYMKRIRSGYGKKYNYVCEYVKKHIPYKRITGDKGKHVFIELSEEINTDELLMHCRREGVIFIPGSSFFIDNQGRNTLRLSFSNLPIDLIETGIKVIGQQIRSMTVHRRR